jgi:hypothetical protein
VERRRQRQMCIRDRFTIVHPKKPKSNIVKQ